MEKLRKDFEVGKTRARNPEYFKILQKRRSIKDIKVRRRMLTEARKLPSYDRMDPYFKRLKYVRYADDFVVMIAGSLNDAQAIKTKIKDVLQKSCGLELSVEKTAITNLHKEGFKFLGATCNKARLNSTYVVRHGKSKTVKAKVRLRVNADIKKICERLSKVNIAKRNRTQEFIGTAKNALINLEHADILAFYNSKMRGILSFYSFAGNRSGL